MKFDIFGDYKTLLNNSLKYKTQWELENKMLKIIRQK